MEPQINADTHRYSQKQSATESTEDFFQYPLDGYTEEIQEVESRLTVFRNRQDAKIPFNTRLTGTLINVRVMLRAAVLAARQTRTRGYATFCILFAKSRPDVGGGRGLPS